MDGWHSSAEEALAAGRVETAPKRPAASRGRPDAMTMLAIAVAALVTAPLLISAAAEATKILVDGLVELLWQLAPLGLGLALLVGLIAFARSRR